MNTPQEQPITLLSLCAASTKESDNRKHAFITQQTVGIIMTPAQAKLHDRCTPEVVRAVYEALQNILLVAPYHEMHGIAEDARNALAILDGHNLNTEKK